MGQATRGTGLVAAGIGWGIAAGVALGTLLIAPALEGSLGTGSVTASDRVRRLGRRSGHVDPDGFGF